MSANLTTEPEHPGKKVFSPYVQAKMTQCETSYFPMYIHALEDHFWGQTATEM